MTVHTYTTKHLAIRLTLTVAGAVAAGILAGRVVGSAPGPTVEVPAPSYTVPSGTPSPSLPASEDTPGWDCRVQGNHVCRIDGELWLNVNHLPASLYARCLLGLGATGLSPEVASIDTEQICKPLLVNGG